MSNMTTTLNCKRVAELNYTFRFDFETDWDEQALQLWFERNWHWSFYIAGFYLLLIGVARHLMKNRPPFQLRGPLFLWNVALSVFSTFGAFRSWAYVAHLLDKEDFYFAVCRMDPDGDCKVFAFWVMYFAFSKVAELGDTVFIVLRKQPLMFLHWYHHLTVLIYVWYTTGQREIATSARWFMTLNYTVHSFMYTYYALKVVRFRIPRSVSMLLTGLQLSQMTFGFYLAVWTLWLKLNGKYCRMTDVYPKISLFVYFTYFVLFLHFFYKAYIHRKVDSMKKGS